MYRASLKVKRLSSSATLPRRAHTGDAGVDLYADEDITIAPGAWARIQTGIAIELPNGTEGQIRPRSGIAAHHGVTVLNAPGTIDASYRGPVDVILINLSSMPFHVEAGSAIAQLVIAPVVTVDICEVARLEDTERGTKGFGSTGGI